MFSSTSPNPDDDDASGNAAFRRDFYRKLVPRLRDICPEIFQVGEVSGPCSPAVAVKTARMAQMP